MTELPKNYDFRSSEKKWQEFWAQNNINAWNPDEPREDTFVVDTPPPTVSGQLHMGHIFSYTQADFVVRFQRMRGKNIFYPMGFDDNGLPTERLVEKQKDIRASNMDRAEFIKVCEEVVESEEEKFREFFKSIALSVDWNLEYQSISARSRKISQMSFLDLVQKDQVYRSDQPMLWDPVDQTALAQADIEDKERQSVMNDIEFKTEAGEVITIATTRPELLPACVAVFYHPDDARYKKLEGKRAITPLFEARVPILADDKVQMEKGTGLVMCCTFGDSTDIMWWQKHKLETKIILDKMGRVSLGLDPRVSEDLARPSDQVRGRQYHEGLEGLKVNAARTKVIELLKEAGLLIKQTPILQTVKCAERSGAPLEILATKQWFVKTLEHREAMLKRSAELNWHPKSMKNRLDNWINGLSWDWCISRQRFFGVPFPVWYSKRAGEEGRAIFASLDQLPVDPLVDLPHGYTRDEVEADKDVMDTWATSAVSPQLSSHGISKDFAIDYERHQKLFPADLRPQAHEILRTWAFNTILKGHLHENVLPWKNIMISGWCLAADKTKMSKSKGNAASPEVLIEQYGADVIRYWASTSRLGADTAYSEDVVKNGKRLANKLWNAAKFVISLPALSHYVVTRRSPTKVGIDSSRLVLANSANDIIINPIEAVTHTADKWLISKLHTVVANATKAFSEFEYAQAMEAVEEFFWKDFCDNYLEIVKGRAYNEDGSDAAGQQSAIATLLLALETILRLMAPFMPHITEELYQTIFAPSSSVHGRGSWPHSADYAIDEEALRQGEVMVSIIDEVRKSKAEKNLSVKADVELLEVSTHVELSKDLLGDLTKVTSSKAFKHSMAEGFSVNVIYP
jgi:valyl-tRNA synthetase